MTTPITGTPGVSVSASCTGPSAGEGVDAASVNGPFQSIVDDLATLDAIKVDLAGDTMTGTLFCQWESTDGQIDVLQPGALLEVSGHSSSVAAAQILCNGKIRVAFPVSGDPLKDGILSCGAGTTVDLLGRTRIGPVKDLSDADHVLWDAVTDGCNQIRMLTSPAGNRTLTLPQPAAWATSTGYTSGSSVVKANGHVYLCSQSGTSASGGTGPSDIVTGEVDGTAKWDYMGLAPVAGDWFEVTVLLSTGAFTVVLQRAGSVNFVATIGDGNGTSPWASNNLTGTAKVRFDGTNWKLLSAAGSAFYGSDS